MFGAPAPGPTLLPDPVAVAFDAAGLVYVLDQRALARARLRPRGQDRPHDRPPRHRPGQAAVAVGARGRRRPDASTSPTPATGGSCASRTAGTLPRLLRPASARSAGSRSRRTAAASTASDAAHQPDHGARPPTGGDLARDRRRRDQAGRAALARARSRSTRAGQRVGRRSRQRPRAGVRARRHAADRVRRARDRRRASSSSPTGIAVDCHGLVTVADSDNNRVQQFQAAPAGACAALPAVQSPPRPDPPDAARRRSRPS